MVVINGNFKQYKLENGLTVAMQKTPTQTISSKLRVNQGAYHEKPGEEGMAHFLEHCLVTGGSKKYNPIKADLIRNSFGHTNAFTSLGRTFFIGEMLSEDIETWLDYTSDHIFNPRFDLKRVNGERQRVLREISDRKSNPSYIYSKQFQEIFYQNHPKKIEILGSDEVVKNASLEKIASFHSRGFNANNMELILVGGLPENISDLIEKNFSQYPVGKNTSVKFPALKPLKGIHTIHFSAPEMINQENPNQSSAGISLNYNGPKDRSLDYYSFIAMNFLMGGDTNSLLFKNLGLKEGLAYSSSTSYDGEYNAAVADISAIVPANKIDLAINSIFKNINIMKNKKISEKEMNRLKRIIKYTQAREIETNQGHLGVIESKLDGKITPEINMKRWDRITPNSIQNVANKYLPTKNGNYMLYIKDPLKKN